MPKLSAFQILTLFSILGMIGWNITDNYGGMIIHLFQYWYIIIPILIFYIISIFITLNKIASKGIKSNKIIFGAHVFFVLFIFSNYLLESDLLKSKRIFTGTMKDDLAHYTLIFREDGTCENHLIGFLGFEQKFNGKYSLKGDTIIFLKKPYDNDFLPDTLLLDLKQKAIFTHKNKLGNFNTKKEWLNHFELK